MLNTLDELRNLIADLPGPDEACRAAAEARDAQLTKPAGSLARLADIATWLAAWQAANPPSAERIVARAEA